MEPDEPVRVGAEPSGASVAALNALRLAAFTTDDRWRAIGERALRAYAGTLAEQPVALTDLMLALDFALDAPREVVLIWPAASPEPAAFLDVLRRTFLPSRALAGAPEGPALVRLGRVAPVAAEKVAAGGRPTAYVCEHGQCRLPSIAAEKLAAQIAPVTPYR